MRGKRKLQSDQLLRPPLAGVEAMEPRVMLSGSMHHPRAILPHHPHHKKVTASNHSLSAAGASTTRAVPTEYATPTNIDMGMIAASGLGVLPATGGAAVAPFTPAQIRHFYGLDAVSLNGITGDGTGQTIGIVDAFDQPHLLNSTDPNFNTSDLHIFDQRFNLPDPPSFTKVNESGGTTTPTTYVSGWAIESSLDVEWAHAMAPAANIVLVECDYNSFDDLLTYGAATAGRLASVVSMSFVGGEFNGQTSYDSVFTQTAGVTFLASAGDAGASSTGYPAFSPNVVAVGGTQITTSDSNGSYGSEAVWNDSYGATGGAVSTVETKPGYQSNVTIGGTARVAPDVAFDAAPSTGVYVYDSSQSTTGSHLYRVGGTSVSSPCWAGVIAVTNQARALLGLGSLSGSSQTLPRLYQLPSSDFHDITSGNNRGYSAGPGYDATTGLGTPIAPLLIPDLAGGGTISGRVFQDNNANGTFDGSDTALAGLTVYLDLNNNGLQDSTEPTAVTDSSGYFTFPDQIGGETGAVRLASAHAGFVVVTGNQTFAASYGSSQSVDTALFPDAYTDAAAGKIYTIGLNAGGSTVQISVNGTIAYSAPVSLPPSFTFNLTGTGDGLVVDGTNGNPVPTSGIVLTGGPAGDPLTVLGTATGNDAFTVTSSSIAFGSNAINFSNVSSLNLNPGAGTDSLVVDSGSVVITAQNPGSGILTRQLSALTLAANAAVAFATATSHADRTLAITAALTVAAGATLDLGGNDLVIQNGDLATITGLIGTGYGNGSWTDNGIASSAAANDSSHLTALGVIANDQSIFNSSNPFDGYAAGVNDVLVKYTYYGDANLDGQIDGSDYTLIDSGYNSQLTGWQNGDFNYDTHVDGSDYSLIDNAYNTQGSRE